MQWSIGKKLGIGFTVILFIFVIIGVISFRNTSKLVQSTDWVTHTYDVLRSSREILSELKDAETGQRGFLITGRESYLEPYHQALVSLKRDFENIRGLVVDNPRQQSRIHTLEMLVADKLKELQSTIDLRRGKNLNAVLPRLLTDEGRIIMDKVRQVIGEIQGEETNLLSHRKDEERARAQETEATILYGTLFAVILGALLGYFTIRNISRPLRQVTDIAGAIAAGDLTSDITPNRRKDEVGALVQSFVEMTHSIRDKERATKQIATGDLTVEVIPKSEKDALGVAFSRMASSLQLMTGQLKNSVTMLGSSASEILAVTTQVASGASQTAAAVSETTSTLEEVKQAAQVSSQKAKYLSDTAQKSVEVSQLGKKAAQDISDGMNNIREQMNWIAKTVGRMSEQSQDIGEIIVSVNDLTEQSNLLAVNAAIEAAKAGEQGKGFAVVAQEVKFLAEQSKQATAKIRSILNDIQKATSAAVQATERGNRAVDSGIKQTQEAGQSISSLADVLAESSKAATQIAISSQQQLVGMDQVALAMENIKTASGQNVDSTKQAESAAKNLHDLGQKLAGIVSQYKVA